MGTADDLLEALRLQQIEQLPLGDAHYTPLSPTHHWLATLPTLQDIAQFQYHDEVDVALERLQAHLDRHRDRPCHDHCPHDQLRRALWSVVTQPRKSPEPPQP